MGGTWAIGLQPAGGWAASNGVGADDGTPSRPCPKVAGTRSLSAADMAPSRLMAPATGTR